MVHLICLQMRAIRVCFDVSERFHVDRYSRLGVVHTCGMQPSEDYAIWIALIFVLKWVGTKRYLDQLCRRIVDPPRSCVELR